LDFAGEIGIDLSPRELFAQTRADRIEVRGIFASDL
jgi:hypothetical protein